MRAQVLSPVEVDRAPAEGMQRVSNKYPLPIIKDLRRGCLRPDIGTCKPLACRNVALTADNVDNLRAEITHIDHDLDARPLLPPLLRHQLQVRRNDIEAFLARHSQENS
jgi:hypothetical protein